MPDIIRIKRNYPNEPLGFKIQGGQDFSIPLSVLEVTENSLADHVGLRPGDAIIKINNAETSWMEHNRAKQEIINAGDEVWITVVRNAVNPYKPQLTPLSTLRSHAPVNLNRYTVPAPIKTSLAVEKQPSIIIGSSHNRAPMPFNKNVGSSVVYQAQKPSNWQPGDYSRLNESHAPLPPQQRQQFIQSFNPTYSMYNPNQYEYEKQYADPQPALKADLMEEIRNQTKVNTSQSELNRKQQEQIIYQNPINYQMAKAAPLKSAAQPRSSGSLSMRMLEKGLHEWEGTDKPATSIFDVKRGNNPTGANVPKGFRSVMAPVELPPEMRHAPMHKEYQVHHNKQNWIEPKML